MYTILLWDAENLWTEIATVDGCEVAFKVYKKACEIAEITGKDCALMDTETGEILEYLTIEEE